MRPSMGDAESRDRPRALDCSAKTPKALYHKALSARTPNATATSPFGPMQALRSLVVRANVDARQRARASLMSQTVEYIDSPREVNH